MRVTCFRSGGGGFLSFRLGAKCKEWRRMIIGIRQIGHAVDDIHPALP